MMGTTKAIVTIIGVFSLAACALQAQEKKPALLPAKSEQARAEIITLVSQSLGGKTIPIANDVFQQSSKLLIGKTAVTSPEGIKFVRADNEVAIAFELLKQGQHCILRRVSPSQEWTLTTTKCVERS